MANNQGPKEQGGGSAANGEKHQPKMLTPSEIAELSMGIVKSLEVLDTQSQRRVIESCCVQLGITKQQSQQRERQQQNNNNQQQRRT